MRRIETAIRYPLRRRSLVAPVIHIEQGTRVENIISIGRSASVLESPIQTLPPSENIVRFPKPKVTEEQAAEIIEQSTDFHPKNKVTELTKFNNMEQQKAGSVVADPEVVKKQRYDPRETRKERLETHRKIAWRPRRPSRCLAQPDHPPKKCRGRVHLKKNTSNESFSTNLQNSKKPSQSEKTLPMKSFRSKGFEQNSKRKPSVRKPLAA